MADGRTIISLEIYDKANIEVVRSGGVDEVTSIQELKNKLKGVTSTEELRFHTDSSFVLDRELLDALQGLTVKDVCTLPASFESVEVYKDFLPVMANTEVIQFEGKPPVVENLLKTDPFVKCRVLNFSEKAKVTFSPEEASGWLQAKSPWKDARVLTFYVATPKEAVEVSKSVVKAFEDDKERHTYELFLHGGGDAVRGIQHTAFNRATGEYLSASSVIGALFLKRSDRTYQRGPAGQRATANVVSSKALADLLEKAVA